ncbi:alpha/beta hydrolase [Rhodobacteraceae bacterium KMM 6894]|nr:alpha/beta hydrolase [Rhodobacteraceae bacterium KMM 6894]
MDDGAQIAVRRWSAPKKRRLLVSHGNGMAVDAFYPFAEALFDSFEVIAFDLRSHGNSPRVPHPETPWPRYIADIPQIFEGIEQLFGTCETHGAFHSMASVSTLCAQTFKPSPWASLTLFEPPITPSDDKEIRETFNAVQQIMGARALRRRRTFSDPSVLAASFRRAATFDGVSDSTLGRLAIGSVFRSGESVDEPWELVLPPEAEASNFSQATGLTAYWDALVGIRTPIQIVTGDPATHDLPNLVDIARHMSKSFGYPVSKIPNTNHFMQLQEPLLCAEKVRDFALTSAEHTNSVQQEI